MKEESESVIYLYDTDRDCATENEEVIWNIKNLMILLLDICRFANDYFDSFTDSIKWKGEGYE